MALSILPLAGLLGAAISIFYFWTRAHRLNDYKHIPRVKPDTIFGHIKLLGEAVATGRPNENIDYVFQKLVSSIGWPSVCLFDLRPIHRRPLLIVSSHEVAEQIAKPSPDYRYSVTKSDTLNVLRPLIGSKSIITKEGEEWKRIRSRYNPAFARSNLISSLPAIVAMSQRFLNILDSLSHSGKVFVLGDLTTALTFDVIGIVVLGLDVHAQEGSGEAHPLYKAFADIAHCYTDESVFSGFDPTVWWNKRQRGNKLDTVVKEIITSKFNKLNDQKKEGGRSVLEISLRGVDKLTPEALQESADSQKTFLFAGHDTTSITLQWAFYQLGRYPDVAAALKAELDQVFGEHSDANDVCRQILERGEEALKQLAYTRAVIKETLRLYPPASSARLSSRGKEWTISLPETGERVDVSEFTLYLNHFLIGRDPKVYGDNANEFYPDRWIGNSNTGVETLYERKSAADNATKDKIPDAAWRPFERGPRNCIGQELANIEACVILALVARDYKFTKVGAGALEIGPKGEYVLDEATRSYKTVGGQVLYNRRQITSRPIDDMRMTVSKR